MSNAMALTVIDMLESTLNSGSTKDGMTEEEAKAIVQSAANLLKKEFGIA